MTDDLAAIFGELGAVSGQHADGELRISGECAYFDGELGIGACEAPGLHDLALLHRLTLAAGRQTCAVSADMGLAISHVTALANGRFAPGPTDYSARFAAELPAPRKAGVLRAQLGATQAGQHRTTQITFSLLPAALVGFVRKSRGFVDYLDWACERPSGWFEPAAPGRHRYNAGEADRLSGGVRVDHVPALRLLDLALQVCQPDRLGIDLRSLSAEFLRYADPRSPLELRTDRAPGVVEIVQDDLPVARVAIDCAGGAGAWEPGLVAAS